MDWIITLIVVYGFIRLIMFLSNKLDGSEKPQVSKKSQVSATPKEPPRRITNDDLINDLIDKVNDDLAREYKAPRRITIDDLAREYDEVFEWGDTNELANYLEKWHNRTFVVRGCISPYEIYTPNPRVETYALDYNGEHTELYVSLSLVSRSMPFLKNTRPGPFHADFLFPVNTSIDTLISKGCTEFIVQGTFSGILTLSGMLADARKERGLGGVTAIFTDCKILREF